MYLVAPEVLADGRGLSVDLCICGIVLGLFLWGWGWWSYRFLLVLTTTTLAGLAGIAYGKGHGLHPMVAGLLFAVSAGYLALSLARLLAFVGGGLTGCLLASVIMPRWDEPVICFLLAGFLGLILVRYWMMIVTSLVGTLIITYSTLWLLDRLGKLNAVTWAEGRLNGLNWLCLALTGLGVLTQFYLARRLGGKAAADDGKGDKGKGAKPADFGAAKKWWGNWQSPFARKAA